MEEAGGGKLLPEAGKKWDLSEEVYVVDMLVNYYIHNILCLIYCTSTVILVSACEIIF